MENLKNCPVCGGSSFSDHLTCKDHTVSKATFNIQRCTGCGFLFTNPRPSKEEIGPYYESKDYISHSNTNKGLFNRTYQVIRNRAIQGKIALIRKEIGGKTENKADFALLDIGCGTGEFLNGCLKTGWKVLGIEPGEGARKQSIDNYGLRVEDESYLNRTDEKFNVITMWHVLEHVHDLSGRLDQLFRLIKDDGVLIIAVPNHTSKDATTFGKEWAAWDVPRHLYHFSPKIIKQLLGKHGFSHVSSYPMKYDAYYVSLLSTGYVAGKKSALKGFINGLASNLAAKGDPENFSSVIYTFRKNK